MINSQSTAWLQIILITFLSMNVGLLEAQSMMDTSVQSAMRDTINIQENQDENIISKIELPFEDESSHDQPTYTIVEKPPQFPGGTKALRKYLSQKYRYPRYARKNNIEGKMFITFVIDAKGNVRDVKILRSLCEPCDAEAIRLVKSMPKWKPGYQKGKPVNVQFNLPISLSLNK